MDYVAMAHYYRFLEPERKHKKEILERVYLTGGRLKRKIIREMTLEDRAEFFWASLPAGFPPDTYTGRERMRINVDGKVYESRGFGKQVRRCSRCAPALRKRCKNIVLNRFCETCISDYLVKCKDIKKEGGQ